MKIGVCINHLGISQLAYHFINNVNIFLHGNHKDDVVCFYETLAPPCVHANFACMPTQEAFSYDGVIMPTSLPLLSKSLKFLAPQKIIYYMWDLEWMRIQHKQFDFLQQIYSNTRYDIICRSKDHADALMDVWGRKATIIDNFDMLEITKYVKKNIDTSSAA